MLFVTARRMQLFILAGLFAFTSLQAQDVSRNAVYVELATRGPIYTINYDRMFRQGQKLDYSFSAGFSVAKNALAFPLGLHFITGSGDHHAEFGLGIIPYFDYNDPLVGSNKDQSDKYIYINPGIGYRYQPKRTSLFFKALIGPSIFLDPPAGDFWNMDPKLFGFGSAALGISF